MDCRLYTLFTKLVIVENTPYLRKYTWSKLRIDELRIDELRNVEWGRIHETRLGLRPRPEESQYRQLLDE